MLSTIARPDLQADSHQDQAHRLEGRMPIVVQEQRYRSSKCSLARILDALPAGD